MDIPLQSINGCVQYPPWVRYLEYESDQHQNINGTENNDD